ncbi:beta-galactosidase [Salinarimonas sp.]|uniref:beta-galactosidase n=1 Tax=Salinarimonas sp. TaxID=2766526 RepID=UPI00391B6927
MTRGAWPGLDRHRPILVGELPYYRMRPERWRASLEALREAGIDVVSFYVPWRFHELGASGQERFDFTGRTDAQKDVVGFMRAIAETGLAALVKPGPFIHAEVQLGGLPDRLCDPMHVAPYEGADGGHLMSQGKPLPKVHDPRFRREVDAWMEAVNVSLIEPFAHPRGPVVAVQLGNEGVLGEACKPVRHADLGAGSQLRGAARARAAAELTVQQWSLLSSRLHPSPVRVVNAPLVRIGTAAEPGAFGSWLARSAAFRAAPVHLGHTEWVGDASSDPSAFLAHALQIGAARSDVAEANWGFTWTTGRFAQGAAPLFHALLALVLGARILSVYTACATGSWGSSIDMDADGLVADGFDPTLYAPPYCPGAPFDEMGGRNVNHGSLLRLRSAVDAEGAALLESTIEPDLVLAVDPLAAAQASEEGSMAAALDRLVERMGMWLFAEGRHVAIALDPRDEDVSMVWRGEADTDAVGRRLAASPARAARGLGGRIARFVRSGRDASFLGLFNPHDRADEIALQIADRERRFHLPARSGLLARIQGGEVAVVVATDAGATLVVDR